MITALNAGNYSAMAVIRTLELDILMLPNLKKYYIFSTMVLFIFILSGQFYQDYNHKQEYLDAQRIYFYQKQASLNESLIDNLLAIRNGNVVSRSFSVRQFSVLSKQANVLHSKLARVKTQRHMNQSLQDLAKEELMLAGYIDNLLLVANEVLVLAEANQLDDYVKVSTLYEQMLVEYQHYKNEYQILVEKLSDLLQLESYQHRMSLWLVVGIFLVLIIIAGVMSYRIVASLAKEQAKLVEQDNQRRKENEQEVMEQVALMHAHQMKMLSILDYTVDAIITITGSGQIESFNKAAEKMFGYLASDVLGQNVKLLMPDEYAKHHDSYLKNYMETGIRKVIGQGREVVGQRKDKSQFPIHLSVSEVPDSQPRLFTGIIYDLTKWKKADEQLQQTLAELRNKQATLEEEEKIARHVFANITASNNDNLPELASWIVPMGTFSGDMMLSAVLPSGATRVILCDFTGHGLPAALGAVPVSSIHKAMAQKGLPLEVLMEELNNKLKDLLPTGIFCCIAGIDIDATRTHAHIWNAGLPEVLLVGNKGDIKQRVKSVHLPLGVARYTPSERQCEQLSLEAGDSLYVYSDGMTEAENPEGEMFGQQRFESLLTVAVEDGDRMQMIQNTVTDYINNAPANDDLSLLQIKTLVTVDEIILKS